MMDTETTLEQRIHEVRLAAGNNQFTVELCGKLADICTLALSSTERAIQNAALLAEAERQRWQPIETHDKSRRAVLVWCPKWDNIYEVCWRDEEHLGDAGWFHFSGLGDRLREPPTHWMPLPEPPPAIRQATGEEGA